MLIQTHKNTIIKLYSLMSMTSIMILFPILTNFVKYNIFIYCILFYLIFIYSTNFYLLKTTQEKQFIKQTMKIPIYWFFSTKIIIITINIIKDYDYDYDDYDVLSNVIILTFFITIFIFEKNKKNMSFIVIINLLIWIIFLLFSLG